MRQTLYVATASLLALPTAILSHSWIDEFQSECLNTVGYARNYPGRDYGGNIDELMTYRFETTDGDLLLLAEEQRTPGAEVNGYPKLQAPAGSVVNFFYTPNGHVSIDHTNSTYSIHWNNEDQGTQLTYRSDAMNSEDEPINTVPGAEAIPFDDNICGEGKSADPCMGSFVIPADANLGLTQFVWFWKFNRAGIEEYTTGFDIEILPQQDCDAPVIETTVPESIDSSVEVPAPAVVETSTLSTPAVDGGEPEIVLTTSTTPMEGECAAVSEGDAAVDISAVADSRCPDYVGCRDDGCRFCKSGADNDKNSHLDTC